MRSDEDWINEIMIDIRRNIHEYPEMALKETRTADVIYQKLIENGFTEVYTQIGITGVVAVIRGELNESILIRADMDALPITENTDYPFKSKIPGMDHACGHDGHVAILLGTAIYIMKKVQTEGLRLKKGVKFCFQPAEENSDGSLRMINDTARYDLLESEPRVTNCYGLHILSTFAAGMAAHHTNGNVTARSERFQVSIVGRGGHSSSPQDTIDATQIGVQICNAIYQVRGRSVNQTTPSTISIGIFQSGTSPNIINQTCLIQGSIRTIVPEDREKIVHRLQTICDGAAIQHEAQVSFQILGGTIPIYNDPALHDQMTSVIETAIGSENMMNFPIGLGGENFAEFSIRRPSAYLAIGGGPADQRFQRLPDLHHSPEFWFDESALLVGFKIWRQLILSL